MRYESKFSIGQTVWCIERNTVYQIVKCPTCLNTGKVTISAEEFICPKCLGRSACRQNKGERWYVSYDDVVGRVTVEETVSHAYPEESGLKITYMLHGTGVGSGQVWKEERLFATREEAAEFCDRTNRPVLTDECEMLPEVK